MNTRGGHCQGSFHLWWFFSVLQSLIIYRCQSKGSTHIYLSSFKMPSVGLTGNQTPGPTAPKSSEEISQSLVSPYWLLEWSEIYDLDNSPHNSTLIGFSSVCGKEEKS